MIGLPGKYTLGVLSVGVLSPNFNLLSSDSSFRGIYNYRGSFVVLYFYPSDDMNRSLSEIKLFRDKYKFFQEHDIMLLAISDGTNYSERQFSLKYAIPFPILSDDDKKVSSEYKVLNKDNNIKRTTFLISNSSKILRVWSDSKLKDYYKEIFVEVEKNI